MDAAGGHALTVGVGGLGGRGRQGVGTWTPPAAAARALATAAATSGWAYNAADFCIEIVGDFNGGDDFMRTGTIIAANPKCFRLMVQQIRPHLEVPAGSTPGG